MPIHAHAGPFLLLASQICLGGTDHLGREVGKCFSWKGRGVFLPEDGGCPPSLEEVLPGPLDDHLFNLQATSAASFCGWHRQVTGRSTSRLGRAFAHCWVTAGTGRMAAPSERQAARRAGLTSRAPGTSGMLHTHVPERGVWVWRGGARVLLMSTRSVAQRVLYFGIC